MGLFKKLGNLMGVPEEEYDDEYGDDIDFINNQSAYAGGEQEERYEAPEAAPAAQQKRNKVVNINATTQLQVVLVKPDRFDLVSDIADHLRDKQAVVLNLESTNKDVARRLVDFLSGCAYALDGKIKKIAISTYLITPYNVDVVGDLVEELENNGMYF